MPYAELEGALRSLFPDLPLVEPLRYQAAGFNGTVYEAGGVIVRVGRTLDALRSQARLVRLLRALRPVLPVPIPAPEWHAGASPAFPFGVLCYRTLPGTVLWPHMLGAEVSLRSADDLAHFLLALHAFPLDEARALGVPRWDARAEARAGRDLTMDILRPYLTPAEHARVDVWWDAFLADAALAGYEPRLIHGDFWYENILVDAESVALRGVLDFEEARVGDVAQDFAVLRYLGHDFAGEVLRSYIGWGGEVGERIQHRIDRLWEYRELPVLPSLYRAGNVEELADSVRKLRAGPILGGTGPA